MAWHKLCAVIFGTKNEGVNSVKIDSELVAGLILATTTLWARIAIQGFEQGFLSTAIEYGFNGMKAVRSVWLASV
jgi:hypothetical protein